MRGTARTCAIESISEAGQMTAQNRLQLLYAISRSSLDGCTRQNALRVMTVPIFVLAIYTDVYMLRATYRTLETIINVDLYSNK